MRNQSSAPVSLISRKQQLECRSSLSLSGCLGPTAALISPVIILTVFAQPCWHMFHNLRWFCFNLSDTLRRGHSHWLDLLIQLVFFDENPSPPPSLSSSLLSLPSPALLLLTLTLASNLVSSWCLLSTRGSGSGNQTCIPSIVCTASEWPTADLPSVDGLFHEVQLTEN